MTFPLITVFSAYLMENTLPSVWKEALVVPVHRRSSRSDPQSYSPISLLSVGGKVFDRVVSDVCRRFSHNHLLSDQQFEVHF